jgi:integrase
MTPPLKRRESPVRRVNPSGKVAWKARYTNVQGQRVSAGTYKRQSDAQDAIDAAYQQMAAPAQDRNRDALGAYARDWTERHPRSERTDATNDHRIGRVLDVEIEGRPLRDWPLQDLRRRHANDLFDHMLRTQGRSVGGAKNILRALSAMAEDAIEDELIDANPFKGLKLRADDRRASKQPREPRVWTWEQMHAFAAHAGVYEPMVRMLADCGLRIGELLGLQRELQDLRAGVFTVKGSAWNGKLVATSRTKRHDREGPIPPTCLAMLRAMPPRIDSPWLYPTPGSKRVGNTGFDRPGGLLWRYDNWRRDVWIPTCEAAGMRPTPQEFRASFNTLLLAEGIDRADLADVLGHSEDVNAARYTRALRRSGDAIRRAIG